MKKFYSKPTATVELITMRYNMMEETAQEVLAKKRDMEDDEEFELEEEEEFGAFIMSQQEESPLW